MHLNILQPNETPMKSINSIVNCLWKAPRKILYTVHKMNLKRQIHFSEVSIISQNCIGGVIYSLIGQEFLSPTINMFIEDENFIKLVNNLEYYMLLEPKPLTDEFIDPISKSIRYPKICIDDIELCCLHYKNCQDAIEAWERRKSRVNFNKVLVIANSWNMHEDKIKIEKLCSNPKYKTICFTYNKYNYDNCIQINGDKWILDERMIIRPNITDFKPYSAVRYFEDYVDIVKILNEYGECP